MKMSRVRFLPRALHRLPARGFGAGRRRERAGDRIHWEAPMLSDFKKFVLRGNVVDLAVAIVVGTAFTAMVAAFVKDFITPLIAAIFGKSNFSSLPFPLHNSKFNYGSFINTVISFLIIATVVFFAVVLPLNA